MRIQLGLLMRFVKGVPGVVTVEYSLIVGLAVLVMVASATSATNAAKNLYSTIGSTLSDWATTIAG